MFLYRRKLLSRRREMLQNSWNIEKSHGNFLKSLLMSEVRLNNRQSSSSDPDGSQIGPKKGDLESRTPCQMCNKLWFLFPALFMYAAGMTIMAVSVMEICENTKLAREMALTGNYESAGVYYQGVVQMIHRLLITISDKTRKSKWQLVSQTFSYKVPFRSSKYPHVMLIL